MSKRPTDPGFAPGWCVYYRSAGQYDTCEQGVPYSNFKPGIVTTPCFCGKPADEPLKQHCAHRRVPTKEEIKLHKEWAANRLVNLGLAFETSAPWVEEHHRRRTAGAHKFDCPVCKAKVGLYVTITASNGHTCGKCKTKGCVSWIQ